MNEITMTETVAQRNADRVRDMSPRMLAALKNIALLSGFDLGAAKAIADEAVEYAEGAHDPDCYADSGYGVDAAGTFGG